MTLSFIERLAILLHGHLVNKGRELKASVPSALRLTRVSSNRLLDRTGRQVPTDHVHILIWINYGRRVTHAEERMLRSTRVESTERHL